MPVTTDAKGITNGWADGDDGWGPGMRSNLTRLSGLALRAWAIDYGATAALTLGYFGGMVFDDPDYTPVADGTVALTDNTVNFVERTAAGIVTVNTSGYTSGLIPMGQATTVGGALTEWADDRPLLGAGSGGGGGGALDDLSDVAAPSPSDLDVLTFDSGSGNWISAPPPGGGALDDLSDVDASAPADLDVLTFDSGSGNWIPAAPASGGTDKFPDSVPASPTAYDDEFTESSLNARWTAVTNPDGTFTVVPNFDGSYLQMKSPGHATLNQKVIRQALGAESDAGVAVGYTAKLILSATGTYLVVTDFLVGDNTAYAAGNYILFSIVQGSNTFRFQVYDGSTLADVDLGAQAGSVYVHVQRTTGNILKVYISLNGLGYRRIYSGSKTFNFDYLFIRLYGSTTVTEASEHMIDFIRVNDARFTQQI